MLLGIILSTLIGESVTGIIGNRADDLATSTLKKIVDNFNINDQLVNHDLQKAVVRSFFSHVKVFVKIVLLMKGVIS